MPVSDSREESNQFRIAGVMSPEGTLRISEQMAEIFPDHSIINGRATTADNQTLPITIEVSTRALSGLNAWVRGLGEVAFRSFVIEINNLEPLDMQIAPSNEPFEAPAPDTQLSRPETGLYIGQRIEENFNELIPTREAFRLASEDLLTHAFICGVTGTGKTVLGKVLLEEAALKGIPAIAIDLKGDISSLGVFLSGEDEKELLPFVQPRPNESPEEAVTRLASEHRKRLNQWGICASDVEDAKKQISVNVFTPRSNDGFRMALSAFPQPPENLSEMTENDPDAYASLIDFFARQFVARLSLSNILQNKAQGYLYEILDKCFRDDIPMHGYDGVKRVLDEFSSPFMGIDKIGGLDTDDYISERDRRALANSVNALLSGPGNLIYEGWPINIENLIGDSQTQGPTPISIINLSHLEFLDQAYVVGYVAYLIWVWMRKQSGTYEPRLIFYVDEIGGGGGRTAFFPSVAKSPSKPAINYLLRQGRAYGVSCILATQNPGDIDYRGLSNCGTWIVGCLRTERDRKKVREGASDAEVNIDSAMRFLPILSDGHFLIRSPSTPWTIVQERWLMGLHRPLSSSELKVLKKQYEEEANSYVRKGRALLQEEKLDRALEELSEAILRYPYSSSIAKGYLLRAQTYLRQEQFDDAKKDLNQVMKRYFDSEEIIRAKFLLGVCEKEVSNFQMAISHFEDAKKLSTDSEFKNLASSHANYCTARSIWPSLSTGTRIVWWVTGRKPNKVSLENAWLENVRFLPDGDADNFAESDWTLPLAIDEALLEEARMNISTQESSRDTEVRKVLRWCERKTEKLATLRHNNDLEAASELARSMIHRLNDVGTSPPKNVLEEIRRCSELVRARRSEVLGRITRIEAQEFEFDIARLLREMGYTADVTCASGDDGVDVFAHRDAEKIVIQCKRWRKHKIDRSVIDELGGTAQRHDATRAILATTSTFTDDARRVGQQLRIELWDLDELVRRFREHSLDAQIT